MTTPPTLPATQAMGPVQPEERIVVLDVLRGFALLGILVINMPVFNMPVAVWFSGEHWFPHPVDRASEFLVNTFGSGKFNSIFSFLFGVGLTIQLQRAVERNAPFARIYLRRLAALLLFGLAHVALLWIGDVLHVYAILGLLLLLFRRISDRTLFFLILMLLLAPVARSAYGLMINEPPDHPPSYWRARAQEELRIYSQGTYALQMKERVQMFRDDYLEYGFGWFYASMGVTILLGFYAGRQRIFQNLPEHLPFIRRLMFWSLGLGLVCAAGFATGMAFIDHTRPTLLGLLTGVAFQFNRPLMCLFYLSAIVLLCQRPAWQARFAPLASVGRMPLTNYLMQSVICTTIFYSYGLGLFAKVGPALGVLLAFGIFGVQVIYSDWWMARFRFGPLEWLWRATTYGKLPAFQVRKVVAEPA